MDNITKIALTNLTRVCRVYPERTSALHAVLSKDLLLYALPAIEVAQEHNGGDPIGLVLATCLQDTEDYALLLNLYEKLPDNTIALREVQAVITKKMLALAEKNNIKDSLILAEISSAYGAALADIGEYKKALYYALYSSCIYQRHNFDKTENKLQSLFSLGECFMHTGQIEECMLVHTEVVAGYYQLCQSNAEKYTAQYANSLLVMSSYYRLQEKLSKAIDFASHAESQIKRIATPSNDHSYIRHRIIHHLADCYEQIHQLDIAAVLLGDTIKIIRDLSNLSPDNYSLDYINTLETLATIECRLGHRNKAKKHAHDTISQLDALYQLRPQSFASTYSSSLINISIVDITFGEIEQADKKMYKAVTILLPLYQKYPQRFAADMATVYNNQVGVYLALHCHNKAILAAYKALCIYHNLRQIADIAMALNSLSNARMQAGDVFRARRAIRSAVQFYRILSDKNELFLIDLATTLGTLAAIDDHSGDIESSLLSADEALEYWNTGSTYLKNAHPLQYLQVARIRLSCLYEMESYKEGLLWAQDIIEFSKNYDQLQGQPLASILNLYSLCLTALGQYTTALKVSHKEISCLSSLPIDEIPAYQVDLADALVNLCFIQAEAGDIQSLNTIKRAVTLYETLPEPLTLHMIDNKSTALYNLATMAYSEKLIELAVDSLTKAVEGQKIIIETAEEDFYPTDLLLSLQLLCKIYYEYNNPLFPDSANELAGWLEQLPVNPDATGLYNQLKQMQENFNSTANQGPF